MIIELREEEANNNYSNGDWGMTLNFPKDLVLNDGDTLAIKNVFIDTLSQSNQKINIPQAVTYELEFYYYYVYTRQDNLDMPWDGAGTKPALPDIDGEPWIVMVDNSSGPQPGVDLWKINTISLIGNKANPADGDVVITYYDKTNTKQTTTLGPFRGSEENPAADVNCSIIYNKNQPITFTPTDKNFSSSNVKISSQTPVTGIAHLEPYTQKFTGTLLAGAYSPQQLVVSLNRELQSAMKGGTKNQIYTNKFLIDYNSIGKDTYLVKTDGSNVMEVKGNLLFGANFIDIEWVDSTNQFSFEYSFTPYYQNPVGNNPAQPSVGFLKINTDYITINKNSGIIFKSMTSSFPDGTDANLWDKILGFDKTELCVGYTQHAEITIGGIDIITSELTQAISDGVNITGSFIPLTVQMNLVSNNWFEGVDPASGIPFSTANDTYALLGTQQTQGNTVFDYGYFLVSLDANFRSNYLAKNIKENIMAVVSRYYELNSFTSAQDPGMVYVHNGDPITLQDFRIKVLNPSKQVAQNIGNRSAVFVEVIRAQ